MKNPTTSIYAFGVYIVLMGLGLTFAPQLILPPFGLAAPQEVWVRVLGLLALALSSYYLQAARQNLTAFYRMTVPGRAFFGICLIVLGLITPNAMGLVLFALVDLAGAAWTRWALRDA